MQRIVLFSLAALLVLILGGCVMPGGGPMAGMDHSARPGMGHGMTMTDTAMMTGTMMMSGSMMMTGSQMGGMNHSMMMDPAKPFDAQFIDSMIEHHQGAIDMANEVLAQSERPELRQLAEAIIVAQTQEIEQMTAWRQAWYPDLPATGGMGMGMGEMGISSDESTPFDQRFLVAMISHHQGAIDMAVMAQCMAEHQEIKTLADAIITAQQAEIEQMQGWLQVWFGVEEAFSPYMAQNEQIGCFRGNLCSPLFCQRESGKLRQIVLMHR